jgi:hypothetical protein
MRFRSACTELDRGPSTAGTALIEKSWRDPYPRDPPPEVAVVGALVGMTTGFLLRLLRREVMIPDCTFADDTLVNIAHYGKIWMKPSIMASVIVANDLRPGV